MSKCSEAGMCQTMLDKVSGNDGKGLVAFHTANPDTHTDRFLGVAYKTSAKDRGLMLNVCPWCGGHPGYFQRSSAARQEQPK